MREEVDDPKSSGVVHGGIVVVEGNRQRRDRGHPEEVNEVHQIWINPVEGIGKVRD